MACPSASQCTVVGGAGREVTFNPTAPGTPTPITIDPGNGLSGVACPSASQCTVVGGAGREVTFNPTAPGTPTPITIDPGNGLSGVACPSASQCTVVDYSGRETTFNPTAPGSPTPITIDPVNQSSGVSCPSTSQCTVVDNVGDEITFNPTAPGSPTPITIDPGNQFGDELNVVACPSASQCTAVDESGREMTFNPTAPGTPTLATIDGVGLVHGLACPSASQCTAVDQSGNEVTFNPTAPGTPTPTRMGIFMTEVACPSPGQCTAVEALSGTEVTFNPTAPGTPTPVIIDTGVTLTTVSCPSASQCTTGAYDGQEVTFNPTAPGTPTPTTIDTSGGTPFGMACPSTSQCTAVDNIGYEVTFNPTAPGSPTPVAIARNSGDSFYGGVACPSISQCTAIDVDTGEEVTFNPSSPGTRTSHYIEYIGERIACPSTSQCTTVGQAGQEVTFDPNAPGTPTPVTIDAGHLLTAVACPSTSQCTAVDEAGRGMTFDPNAPGTPTLVTIDSGNNLTALACPSTSGCIAVDNHGNGVEGDPTSSASPTVEPIAGATSLTSVACSSVTQCVAVDAVGNGFVSSGSIVGEPPPPAYQVHLVALHTSCTSPCSNKVKAVVTSATGEPVGRVPVSFAVANYTLAACTASAFMCAPDGPHAGSTLGVLLTSRTGSATLLDHSNGGEYGTDRLVAIATVAGTPYVSSPVDVSFTGPTSFIGYFINENPATDKGGACTAWVVAGSGNHSVIATAEHCVEGANQVMAFAPGVAFNGPPGGSAPLDLPFGRWNVESTGKIFTTKSSAPAEDFAFVVLSPNVTGDRIGNAIHGHALEEVKNISSSTYASAFGYVESQSMPGIPTLQQCGPAQLQTGLFGVDPQQDSVESSCLFPDHDQTSGVEGASGGPWVDPVGKVVAVTSKQVECGLVTKTVCGLVGAGMLRNAHRLHDQAAAATP